MATVGLFTGVEAVGATLQIGLEPDTGRLGGLPGDEGYDAASDAAGEGMLPRQCPLPGNRDHASNVTTRPAREKEDSC